MIVVAASAAVAAAPPLRPSSSTAAPRALAIEQAAATLRDAPTRAGRPFAVVDKRTATIRVWRGDGTLAGASTVLLGRTPGDRAVPGTGARTEAGLLTPDDMTTPAGHYASEPGRNLHGEAIVWLDYDNALAIHRLRPGAAQAERLRRLASDRPADKRASAGCVVVPVAFYDAVIAPVLGRSRGWVVVLPEAADATEASL